MSVALLVGALLLGGGTTELATAAPRVSDVTRADVHRVGASPVPCSVAALDCRVRFLTITCPAEESWLDINAKFRRALGDGATLRVGTPIPPYLRHAFRTAAVKHRTAARKLDAALWPPEIAARMPRVVGYYVAADKFFTAADSPRMRKSWRHLAMHAYAKSFAVERLKDELEVRPYDSCWTFV